MKQQPHEPTYSGLGRYLRGLFPLQVQRLLYPVLPGFVTSKLSTGRPKSRVIFLGSSYYNTWYLSRALRNAGWHSETVAYTGEGGEQFLHGTDVMLEHTGSWDYRYPFVRTFVLVNLLRLYAKLRVDGEAEKKLSRVEAWVLRSLMKSMVRMAGRRQRETLQPLVDALDDCDIFHFTASNNLRYFYFFNPRLFGAKPIGWDIQLLKLLGKKIVYTNIGTNDGISQSSIRSLDSEPICDSCRWRDEPEICSDQVNLAWGKLRNSLVDYQLMSYGARLDYNDDPRVHEVPEFFCLDPDFWHPELLVPTNHRLSIPEETTKIYHSVGNFESRTLSDSYRNIKSTHIYIPLIERLKKEGHNVDLVFFHDIPNQQVRYYQVQSDIVVDMLTVGWFGANVREAMMLGKPVVCYLRPEWLESMRREIPDYVDELPVVSATPSTVYDVLKDLIENPEKRQEIGRRGREFAVKWHSPEASAKRMIQIYSSLLGSTAPDTGESRSVATPGQVAH